MTHLNKAMRNQLLASQPGGSKAFLDKHGNSFGWPFILKLNHLLKQEDNAQLKKDVRLDDKVANPTGYRKMDVSCAKKATEHKTCSWAEEVICKALHVSLRELNIAVEAKLSKHPPLQMGNKNGPK